MTEPGRIPTAQRKRSFRTELRRRLARLSPREAGVAAARVADLALETPEIARAKGILTCLSFGHEIDTWGLVDRLLDLGREVYVPRTESGDNRLHVHRYPCELRTLSFGLRQPPEGVPEVDEAALEEVIDVVLVLGLGFDRQGYRLGHGAGYFDRFLAGRTFPAIGLAHQLQLVDKLPVEAHDVPMSAVITELGTFRPDPARNGQAHARLSS